MADRPTGGGSGRSSGGGPSGRPSGRDQGGSMFAAFVTLLMAAMLIFFLVLLSSDNPGRDSTFVFGGFLLLVALFSSLRQVLVDPITDYAAWVLRERRGDPLAGYEPKKPPASVRQYGTNKPTTADDVRAIREQSNVWVPADAKRKRRKKAKRGDGGQSGQRPRRT